ncbi:MAG: hypothetical protein ACI307_09895 [Sodaliphilus sp.]
MAYCGKLASEGVDVRQQLATRWRDVVYEELSPWIKRTYLVSQSPKETSHQ